MARSSRALLAVVVLSAWSLAALAAPGDSFSLGWVRTPGAESCLGPRALAALVERRLGRAVFTSAARADVAIEGRVEPLSGSSGYRVVIRLLDATGSPLGQRELTTAGARCDDIDEPVSLVVALLIDPNASLAPLSSGPAGSAPSPSLPPTASAPASACIEPPPPVAAPAPWRWDASIGGSLALGAVPAPAPGAMARVQLRPSPRWGVALEAGAWRGTSAGEASKGQVAVALSAVTLLGCPLVLERGRVDVVGCAGAQLGQLSAQGQQLDVVRQADRTLVNVAAELRGGVALVGPLRLTAGATGGVLLRRDTFFFRDTAGNRQDLFRPSSLALSVDVGLGLGLP